MCVCVGAEGVSRAVRVKVMVEKTKFLKVILLLF